VSTAAELVASFSRRGIRLALAADGIRYEAPRGAFTSADRRAVGEHRAEIVELLRAEAELPISDGPCGRCASPLHWVEGWPTAGEARWLCPACAAWPAPALAEVFAGLTTAEQRQLDVEAAHGDALAVAMLRELRGDGRAA
jgi:TubC N-terminal docking domain